MSAAREMADESRAVIHKLRWFILVLMGLAVFGCFYAYDSLVPVADFIIKDLGITRAQYGLLFSAYSVPNLILVLVGGILLDKIGIRKAGLLFALLCLLGTIITAAGPTFFFMLLGRFVYGIGTDSLIITENKIICKWFRGKELSFAFGIFITLVRLGNVTSLNLGAPLQAWTHSWRLGLWVAAGVMVVGFAAFLLYTRVDKKNDQYFRAAQAAGGTDKFVVRDIFKFGPSFWFIALLCVTYYSAVMPFVAFSNLFLQKKYGLSAVQGGFYVSIVFISTMICTPLFGLIIDKIGKRATVMIFGSVMLIPIFLTLGLTSLNPAWPMTILGISYSLVPAALWASVPLIVEEKRLGTAFGLISVIQNGGLTVIPWLAGKITDLSKGEYKYTMILFAFLGVLALFFSLGLRFSARKGRETSLELPAKMDLAPNDH